MTTTLQAPPSPLELLHEAQALFALGYHRAAAVTARAAIERHITALYEAHRVTARTGWKANRLFRRVQWLRELRLIKRSAVNVLGAATAIGNDAAHGREVEAEKVAQAIENVVELL